MNTRQIISGSAFMLAMLAIFGVTGIADSGGISLGTYIIMCIVLLLVMVVCIVIGDDDLFEALMKPRERKNRR